MNYQYGVKVWGGFFNYEHKANHKKEKGEYTFDSETERELFIGELKLIERTLSRPCLATQKYEGYLCDEKITLHRISKHKGMKVHTTENMIPCTKYDEAIYHLENKWYLGFNDYPFGESFDYESEKVEVFEWVEGKFTK